MSAAATAPTPDRLAGAELDIRGVSKVFFNSKGEPFRALNPTDITLHAGEFVSVVGPSGCGKSTLLLMTAGLLEPTAGEILKDGKPLDGPVTDVGISFQDHLLLDFRTALDNVLLQATIRHLDKAEIKRRALQYFDRLGLAKAAGLYPGQLSGGMRQRVSLIRSLVHRPSVLLMDEPFGALDALTRVQVRTDLETIWMSERPTVLFITHSVEEAVGLSDRIFVMSPSPGTVVDEIVVDLPRPRPIALGESEEFTAYTNRIYGWFEEMGVLHEQRGPEPGSAVTS